MSSTTAFAGPSVDAFVTVTGLLSAVTMGTSARETGSTRTGSSRREFPPLPFPVVPPVEPLPDGAVGNVTDTVAGLSFLSSFAGVVVAVAGEELGDDPEEVPPPLPLPELPGLPLLARATTVIVTRLEEDAAPYVLSAAIDTATVHDPAAVPVSVAPATEQSDDPVSTE